MRRLFTLAGILLVAASMAAASFQPESLHYKVMFKWGLINKKAGTATLTLKHAPTLCVAAHRCLRTMGRQDISGTRYPQRVYVLYRHDSVVL